jgi:Uma2 family endonuclease
LAIETGGRLPPTPYKPPLVSWEDYLRWALANEFPSEWVDGEIIEIMTSNVRHQMILGLLYALISRHVGRHRLGLAIFDVLMRLPHRPSGRVPDIMFVANENRGRLTNTYLDGPADLAVEVVSPDSETRDRRDKLAEYETAGVSEFWMIDEPRNEAYFYVLDASGHYQQASIAEDGIYTSTVLPGLRLRLNWLWREMLPTLDEALADLPPLPTLDA